MSYAFCRKNWVTPAVPVDQAALVPTKILNSLIHSALASGCHEYEAVDRGLASIFALDDLFQEETTIDGQGRNEIRYFCHQLLINGLEGDVAVARAYETFRRIRLRIAEIGRAIPHLRGGAKRPTKTGKPRRTRKPRPGPPSADAPSDVSPGRRPSWADPASEDLALP
jgi:hypothetical protein